MRVFDLWKSLKERNNYYLPAFQRDYVWDEDDIKSMIDSIIHGYPIGSTLFWKPSREEFITDDPFSAPLADFTVGHGGDSYYVLDG
ncbi:DUF262 domain-containing protein [Pyrococcus furiosus DSM 3638]|uniref:GmrSD restriction endonucleases N-terminal domain-containing protein n=3 Tax=Pyrococcus furiosus TaxID=2261 RepID=Q8U1A6_PYRFU|nr:MULTISPECIES: DUF262 domain-containing protein [Pyrococcus]AAL81439.1 hypothetical protein PF1315 [Pyrococcus furiosus DSM 3638]AFN04098.1 hypothetical protein PFC_05785 [Pyrococcus furiosus COM1]MDK2870201.1 hypothetical protein [Pyrococcus sp.]QEK78954.1 DUF262 domain-containing protein [Pyrococcus furiosus DSM 3638]